MISSLYGVVSPSHLQSRATDTRQRTPGYRDGVSQAEYEKFQKMEIILTEHKNERTQKNIWGP